MKRSLFSIFFFFSTVLSAVEVRSSVSPNIGLVGDVFTVRVEAAYDPSVSLVLAPEVDHF